MRRISHIIPAALSVVTCVSQEQLPEAELAGLAKTVRENAHLFDGGIAANILKHVTKVCTEYSDDCVSALFEAVGKVQVSEQSKQNIESHRKMYDLFRSWMKVQGILDSHKQSKPEPASTLEWLERQRRECIQFLSAWRDAPGRSTEAGKKMEKILDGAEECQAELGTVAQLASEEVLRASLQKLAPVLGGLPEGASWKGKLSANANFPETLAAGKVLVEDKVNLKGILKVADKEPRCALLFFGICEAFVQPFCWSSYSSTYY